MGSARESPVFQQEGAGKVRNPTGSASVGTMCFLTCSVRTLDRSTYVVDIVKSDIKTKPINTPLLTNKRAIASEGFWWLEILSTISVSSPYR